MRISRITFNAPIAGDFWDRIYEPVFSFEAYKNQYMFREQYNPESSNPSHYSIHQLLPDGKIGAQTDSGSWNNYYAILFPFNIQGRVFLFGHNIETCYWFIQEVENGGKLGRETSNGHWNNAYDVLFSFTTKQGVFIYGHNTRTRYWFIQRIADDAANLGRETCNGHWATQYAVQFPFKISEDQYFYGQDTHHKSNRKWFIQHINPDGTLGKETGNGTWAGTYPLQVPFVISGKPYFFGYNESVKNWFIQDFKDNGEMGREVANGTWHGTFTQVFIFSFSGKIWLFRLSTERFWDIQQLNLEV